MFNAYSPPLHFGITCQTLDHLDEKLEGVGTRDPTYQNIKTIIEVLRSTSCFAIGAWSYRVTPGVSTS